MGWKNIAKAVALHLYIIWLLYGMRKNYDWEREEEDPGYPDFLEHEKEARSEIAVLESLSIKREKQAVSVSPNPPSVLDSSTPSIPSAKDLESVFLSSLREGSSSADVSAAVDKVDGNTMMKLRRQYNLIEQRWRQFGWTRHHPKYNKIIRPDLPENEDINQVPRHVILERIGYNPVTDRSPQEYLVAIGAVPQENFDIWLVNSYASDGRESYRQSDLYDLVRMRGLSIAGHQADWSTPSNRGGLNRMFAGGQRPKGGRSTSIQSEFQRHHEQGAQIYLRAQKSPSPSVQSY